MSEKPVVVVTGASGFVASRIIYDLRATQKYQVRATVRNASDPTKTDILRGYGDVQIAEGDLLAEGSFDKAFEGAKYVIHTASPFIYEFKDVEKELYEPAINGTKNVLRSCLKNGVKRVVLTSSLAAVLGGQRRRDPNHVWVEEDWNTDALQRNSFAFPYPISKTLAELGAWEFISQYPEIELVVINPSLVLGPPVSGRVDPTSIKIPKGIFEGTADPIGNRVMGMVDIRTVSNAHIRALEIEKPNQRFIISNADQTSFLDLALLMKKLFPDWPVASTPPANPLPSLPNTIDNSRARNELKVEFYDLETTVKDMLDELIKLGIVQKKN